MRITIVGAGALGSHVIQALRSEDVSLKIIDFDRVESKNVKAQFHPKNGVGKNKAQALAQTMKFLWGTKLEVVPHRLVSDNQSELLDGSDLVIDCLDNAESRRLVQGYCRDRGIACLHGALAADGQFGRVMWSEHFEIDEGVEGAATCEGGDFLPFIISVAAYMARAAQTYIREGKKRGFIIDPTGQVSLV